VVEHERRPDNLQIRFLTRDDIPDLLALWSAAKLSIRPSGRDHADCLAAEMRDYPRNFLGAYSGRQLVGACLATWDGRRGWINRLAVHPQSRRSGVAQQLVAAAEAELKSRGARVIAALVEPGNAPSLALFARCGYRDTPRAIYLSKREDPDA
jgi:N-acetylglutamate synthase